VPSSINVTLGVEVKLVVADNTSGVQSVSLKMDNVDRFGALSTGAYFSVDKPIAGKPVQVNMSLVVPQYALSGRYKLTLDVIDLRGNTLSYSAEALANKSYPHFIDIVNALEDTTPPKLQSMIAVTPTVVNVSSSVRSVTFQAVLLDDLSGISFFSATGSLEDGSSILHNPIYDNPTFGGYSITPIIGRPATFNFTFHMIQSTKPGKYVLEHGTRDAAGNSARLGADQLSNVSSSYTIEVINPEYDGFPPDLKELVVQSPE
jgi:hypothetical protein